MAVPKPLKDAHWFDYSFNSEGVGVETVDGTLPGRLSLPQLPWLANSRPDRRSANAVLEFEIGR